MPKLIPYSTDRDKLEYILSRVEIGTIKAYKGCECWIWTKSKTRDGYGSFTRDKTSLKPHREIHKLCIGPILKEHEIDHLCRNRACCNPLHLEQVTHALNMLRAINSGNWAKQQAQKRTHCPRGHEYTEENTKIRHYPNKNNPNSKRIGRQCIICIGLDHKKSIIAVKEKRRKTREAKTKLNG